MFLDRFLPSECVFKGLKCFHFLFIGKNKIMRKDGVLPLPFRSKVFSKKTPTFFWDSEAFSMILCPPFCWRGGQKCVFSPLPTHKFFLPAPLIRSLRSLILDPPRPRPSGKAEGATNGQRCDRQGGKERLTDKIDRSDSVYRGSEAG